MEMLRLKNCLKLKSHLSSTQLNYSAAVAEKKEGDKKKKDLNVIIERSLRDESATVHGTYSLEVV